MEEYENLKKISMRWGQRLCFAPLMWKTLKSHLPCMRTPAAQREEDKTTAPVGTLQLRGAVAASSWAWGKSQPIFLVGNLMKGLHRKGRGTKSAVVRKMKKGTEKHTTGVHCYCVALLPCCEWGPHSTTSCTNATQKIYIYISAWNHQYFSRSLK